MQWTLTLNLTPFPPTGTSLSVVNPFFNYASGLAPQVLDPLTVPGMPQATSLAADGASAVVLVYQSPSPEPVTFSVTVSTGNAAAALAAFEPAYLVSPNPPAGSPQTLPSVAPINGDETGCSGLCTFLALLWSPQTSPFTPGSFPLDYLSVTAAQSDGGTGAASILVTPPPLLLVHGIWSSAHGAWVSSGSQAGFYNWLLNEYPHHLVSLVDFDDPNYTPNLNSQAFNDPRVQSILLSYMSDALQGAAAAGMAARTVDVVAHSMGGLATRYFLSTAGYLGTARAANPALLPDPVHKLITIGTPHLGTLLATWLEANRPTEALPLTDDSVLFCPAYKVSPCTLGNFFGSIGKPVSSGVQSLIPNSIGLNALSPSAQFSGVEGLVPALSPTEILLNDMIAGFIPGQSIESLLGTDLHDTIVPTSSQSPGPSDGQADFASVTAVHASICLPGALSGACSDVDEPHSPAFWTQAYWWLTGGTGTAPASPTGASRRATPAATAAPPELMLNLNGYTQVAASNVTILPTTGSVLTINSVTNITVSSAKTVTEVLLLQVPMDPADALLLYSTQAPFTISFTPTRLGSASFGAIVVFSDNTYATASLIYSLQPNGAPYALNLMNPPLASMAVGTSRVIHANALYSSGPIDVTQAAVYAAQSGSANVFGVGPGGTITANGNGADFLDVSYAGVTATAPVAVGACTYSLNPSNQIVPYTGGAVSIQVTATAGCLWTASGGDGWLTFNSASGSGNGTITLTAAANNTGSAQIAIVALGLGAHAIVTQPGTACTYSLSQTQINAPAVGISSSITVTTSCPVTASSNQSWVTATAVGSSVQYTISPNSGAARTATLTVGTQSVTVMQAGAPPATPVLATPANGATGISVNPTLVWNAAAGATSYGVYFGTAASPPLVTNVLGTSYSPAALSPGTTYYWEIAATNGTGSSSSATWSFTTEASCTNEGANWNPSATTISSGTFCFQAGTSITANGGFVVNGAANVAFVAGSSIVLGPGFDANGAAGATFTANIQ